MVIVKDFLPERMGHITYRDRVTAGGHRSLHAVR